MALGRTKSSLSQASQSPAHRLDTLCATRAFSDGLLENSRRAQLAQGTLSPHSLRKPTLRPQPAGDGSEEFSGPHMPSWVLGLPPLCGRAREGMAPCEPTSEAKLPAPPSHPPRSRAGPMHPNIDSLPWLPFRQVPSVPVPRLGPPGHVPGDVCEQPPQRHPHRARPLHPEPLVGHLGLLGHCCVYFNSPHPEPGQVSSGTPSARE